MNKSINPNMLSSSLTARKNKVITVRKTQARGFISAFLLVGAVVLTALIFVKSFAVSALTAPTANAGSDLSVIVGEAMRLDGSASGSYKNESQADGTWSIRWETGDGFEAENIIKCPHVYTAPGVYTATLTLKDASGAQASDTVRVTVSEPAAPAPANIQTLSDAGNAEANRNNLQQAVNQAAARSGASEVRVPAGFVFNDPLFLPARTATNYVTVRVADLSTLPANRRVTGSAADRAKLFRMNMRGASQSGQYNGVMMTYGAHYYRIIGLEIRHVASELNTDMIGNEYTSDWRINNSHFIFDRCLLDGNGFETRKGAVLNGETMSLINSSILDIKAPGTETKAVAQWMGAGPLAVVNNRLEAASINSLVGGAPVRQASDILDGYVFRGNHVWKNPGWQGGGYAMKNLFELKQGFNTVAAGNVFENNYQDGQSGEAILIKSMTDEGCAYCEVRQVDFRNNKILNTRAGFNVVNMQAFLAPYPLYANHIRFSNNFWEQTYGRGNLSQGANYFEITHNTFVARNPISYFIAYGAGSTGVPEGYKAPGYKLLNNIAYDDESYGVALRCDHANGAGALNDHLSGDWDVRKNVFGAANSSIHPSGNFYPASVRPEFVDYAGGNYSLKTGSVYRNAGTDGKDLGADWTLLNAAAQAATSGVWNSTATPPNPMPPPNPTPTPTVTPFPTPTPTVAPTPTPTATPTPASWQTQDVGSVGVRGGASFSNGTFTVQGSGADIWDVADAFRYVYQPLSGNGEIVARVASLPNTHSNAKAGVMIRESLWADSRHATMNVTPGAGLEFLRRTTSGGTTEWSGASGTAPKWIKLVRSGSSLSGYASNDGTNWMLVGSQTITMTSNVYIGLAVTSHNNSVLNQSAFDNVSITAGTTPTPTPPPPMASSNYAFGRAASQSSVWSEGAEANRAVDGNTSGNAEDNSITHTNYEENAWWQVDLEENRQVSRVEIWNRTDCCSERLSNFYLIASDTPFVSNDLTSILAQPGVSSYYFNGVVGEMTEIPFELSARHIRIQLAGTGILTIAEVRVFGN